MKPPAIEVHFELKNIYLCSISILGWDGKWSVGSKGEASTYLGEGGSHSGKVILLPALIKTSCHCNVIKMLTGLIPHNFHQRDRILERLRESSDRRTPVPDPLNPEDDEEAVRIIRTRREEREKEREKDREEREKARMLRREEEAKERKRRREEKMSEAETINKVARELMGVREEEKLKSYNAFLPAGVLVVPPGGTVTAMLKVPGLKPRMGEVLDKPGILEQRDELKDATISPTSSLIVQPRDSMFPGIEVTLTSNDPSKELSLDSKIVNFAVATVKI